MMRDHSTYRFLIPILLALAYLGVGTTFGNDLNLAVDEVLEGQIGDERPGVIDPVRAFNPSPLPTGGLEFEVHVQSNFDQRRNAEILIEDGSFSFVREVSDLVSDDALTGCRIDHETDALDESKWGGPDYLTRSGEKLMVAGYGDPEAFKTRLAWAYTEGGDWVYQHDNDDGPKFLLYPLCDQPTSKPDTFDTNLCDVLVGYSGAAIVEVGSYYYIYLDITRTGEEFAPARHGIFLMRVRTQSAPPYIEFGPGAADFWHGKDQTWIPLPFDATWGYYMSVCGDPICGPDTDPIWCDQPFGAYGLGDDNLPVDVNASFIDWTLIGYANPGKLGDVSIAADGSYLLSYSRWLIPANDRRNGVLAYRTSFDPTFAGATEYTVDTTRLVEAIDPDMQRLKSSLYYVGNDDLEYLLFFVHDRLTTDDPLYCGTEPPPCDVRPFHFNTVKVATVRTKTPEIRVVAGVVDQQPDVEEGSTFDGFPEVDPGEPTSRAWKIWNTGLLDLQVTDIQVTGEGFSLLDDPTPASVEPFEGDVSRFAEFRVRLHSNTSGVKTGQVQITHNGPGSPFVFHLQGQVSEPPMEITLASDSFTIQGNWVLDNRPTETGNLTWTANSNALLRAVQMSNNGYVTGPDGSNFHGSVPYNHDGSRAAIVEAKIRPQGSTYTAVGFTINTTSGWFASGVGQVWVRIFPQGLGAHAQYQVCSNGASNCLGGNSPISNYLGDDRLNTVELRYDPGGRTVDLWINGVQELSSATLPGTFVPSLVRAGIFSSNATLRDTRIDNFFLKEEQ